MTIKTIHAALDAVSLFEGGYSNDPDDPGGETNHGVTIGFLQSVRPKATSEDLKKLTKAEARQMFLRHFVLLPKIDMLPDVLQAEVVGLSINAGPRQAIKVVQYLVGIRRDGCIGPDTLKAAQGLTNEDIKRGVDNYYLGLVKARPELAKYIKGWLNRSAGLSAIPEDK